MNHVLITKLMSTGSHFRGEIKDLFLFEEKLGLCKDFDTELQVGMFLQVNVLFPTEYAFSYIPCYKSLTIAVSLWRI